ncbi:MAG: lipid-A-disaccharide synthase [Candidatus Omnitrophota bacterium]
MTKKLMFIAGEPSGDLHSAHLISALQKIDPRLEISGMGGEKMRQAGANIFLDMSELSIIGFTGVLANILKIKKIFQAILARVDQDPPAAVILVDYPGFNLKLAQELKKRHIPVIYYISPQIWAWWPGRIKTIQQAVDKMLVVFKFEEALYKKHGIDVSFVGHPLLDTAYPAIPREELLTKLGLSHQKIIGIMPGSRRGEVERILPVLLQSAKIIQDRIPRIQFVLLKAPQLGKEYYESKIKISGVPVTLCANQTRDFLNLCDFVLAASGTATLETAIMQRPMVIVYKVSFLNWLIAKQLIRLPYIGLVNVVAGRKIVPEFVQFQAQPRLIAQAALEILDNREKLNQMQNELRKVRESLGTPGASQRAAEIILNFVCQ